MKHICKGFLKPCNTLSAITPLVIKINTDMKEKTYKNCQSCFPVLEHKLSIFQQLGFDSLFYHCCDYFYYVESGKKLLNPGKC